MMGIRWASLRLRTRILLAFLGVIVSGILVVLWLTQRLVGAHVRERLDAELRAAGVAFQTLLDERNRALRAAGAPLARDWVLADVVRRSRDTGTEVPLDAATLDSVASNWKRRVDTDLLWLAGPGGALLGDSERDDEGRARAATHPPDASDVLRVSEGQGVITEVDGALHLVLSVPLMAPDLQGFVVLGWSIDDRVARRLRSQAGSEITFATSDRLYASSLPAHVLSRIREVLRQAVPAESSRPFVTAIAGERFLSLQKQVPAALEKPLYALVQESYDRAMQPLRALQLRIASVGLVGVGLAGLIAWLLARGIVAPVQRLVAAMSRVLGGDLDSRLHLQRTDEIGFLAGAFNEMVAGLQERERIKGLFGRFVSREVARVALAGEIPLEGERRDVTIFFQDIRDFTSLSERTDPVELLALLRRFFTLVVASVEQEGGVVKQFTGDGCMALFGAPLAQEDAPDRAVRAALGVVQRLEALNRCLAEEGYAAIRIGIGIHTGEVVAGEIGPDFRVEYGVVGDPVNTASRIEGLTKELGSTILVSRRTVERLRGNFRTGRHATLSVKGRARPIDVVEIVTEGDRPHPPHVGSH